MTAAAKRPPRVTHEPILVSAARAMRDFPAKFSETLEHNQKIKGCCRRMENITGEIFKTSPYVPHPDLFIATCAKCACKHYRVAVSGIGAKG